MATKLTNCVPQTKQTAKVPLKTHFTGDIYGRLEKMRKEKGLTFSQDLIRLAVVSFLEKNGY